MRRQTRLLLRPLEGRVVPATITVTSTADNSPVDAKVTLREAINSINAGSSINADVAANVTGTYGSNDIIAFSTLFNSPQTITRGIEFPLSKAVSIVGPGLGLLTIQATGSARDFNITASPIAISGITFKGSATTVSGNGGSINFTSQTVTLNNVTISGKKAAQGGGIAFTSGTLNATNVTISGCMATLGSAGGGAFAQMGTFNITNSMIQGNSAQKGGGISVSGAATINISDSTVSGNTAAGPGGGIYFGFGGVLNMQRCAVTGNSCAGNGGGGVYLYNTTATISNSTLAMNTATAGIGGSVAVYSSFLGGTTHVRNSTIAFNSAPTGGGIGRAASTVGNINLSSSIAANNTATGGTGPDISGIVASANQSLIGNDVNTVITTESGTIHNQDPLLISPPALNGGVTLNYLLSSGSPAIDVGNSSFPTAPDVDQRGPGFPRIAGPSADIGSVEMPSKLPTVNLTQPAVVVSPGANPGFVQVTYSDDVGILVSSINPSNIQILDPLNNPLMITGVTVDVAANGSPRVATYSFAIPGGAWDVSDNGKYSVNLLANEVVDIDPAPNFVAATKLGTIQIALPINYIVNSTGDTGTGSGTTGDLRYCITKANSSPGVDSITFDSTIFTAPSTITVGSFIKVQDNVKIIGLGAERLTISGGNLTRIFLVDNGGVDAIDVLISGLTIANGKSSDFAPGAIWTTNETVTLERVWLRDNRANFSGGAIGSSSACTVNIWDCTLSGNTASSRGGAVYVRGGSTIVVRNSTFANNKANAGGAIGCEPGITANGTMTVQNSTFTGNSVTSMGGAFSFQSSSSALFPMTIESSIVSGNLGPASSLDIYHNSSQVGAKNTIIGSQTGITTLVNNGGTQIGVNPLLGPFSNHGGPTPTFSLSIGSPAINVGSNPAGIAYDQRGVGFARNVNGGVDIGAYEVQPAPTVSSLQINDGSIQRSRVTSLTVTFDGPVMLPVNPATAFELKRQSDDATVAMSGSVSGNSVTLTFTGGPVESGSLADGRYTLTAFASLIGNSDAQLDGDGNGVGGDDHVLASAPFPSPPTNIFRLFGDADGDGNVAANDFIQFRLALGGSNATFDFDNDGAVAASDFIQFRLRFGGSI